MLRTKDIPYTRINMDSYREKFMYALENFKAAKSFKEVNDLFLAINAMRTEFEAMENLAYLKHMIDLTNEEYKIEKTLVDQMNPIYQGLVTDYYKAILQSPFRDPLEDQWGSQLFKIAELKIKTYSDEIVNELKQEKELIGQYFSLFANAELEFQGQRVGLSHLYRYTVSNKRSERREAYAAITSFYAAQEPELDDLLNQLIKIRTKIAHKLGYENFIKLGYDRLSRTNYQAKDLEIYRNQVKKHGVPFISKLREKQRKRIGIEKLKFYDERVHFKTTPKVTGNAEDIIQNASILFSELSPETREFFEFMMANGNMDLISKKGKRGGAFITHIGIEKAPFIFANFIGIPNDVRVFTHEAGHAFQFYMSRHTPIPEYIAPTFDATEIHSFTMERFAWPWMNLFFGKDTAKYQFSHLTEAFILMPWANAIDEFQHYLYENVQATPDERKAKWRELEKMYMPEKDYDGLDFLERGASFYQIAHIFETPFYFIDYDIAHNCAVQLWIRYNENQNEGWHDFLNICKVGGSESLVELIQRARLLSPFEDGSLTYIIDYVDRWVEQFKDEDF
jgi:M3 family oligoendopeptidase